jgi:prohibitin 2
MAIHPSLKRLQAGFTRLRALPPAALIPTLMHRGVLALAVFSLVLFGPEACLLVIAARVAWVAWQLAPDIEVPLAAPDIKALFANATQRIRRASPASNAPFSPSLSAGVPAMPVFLKKALSLIGVLILLWILAPFTVVPAGNRGVITTFGAVSPEVLGEGLHFRIPIAQTVHLIDVRIQKGEGSGDAASKDLQQIHTTVALNYHIDPRQAANVFQELGQDIGDRIIVPAVQEAVKAATAQYTAEELVAKRPEVRDRIRGLLVERLTRHGVMVDEFSIVNFSFSKSFNEAIEAKTTAEQLKLKAERDLQRIRVEAEQKVTQAKAEAEALAVQKQQVTAELIRLREIENQRKAIEKWDGRLPQVSGGATPFINVQPDNR